MAEKSKKRSIIIILSIGLLVIIAVILLLLAQDAKSKREKSPDLIPVYSEYPPDWIEKVNETSDDVKINVEEATANMGSYSDDQQNLQEYSGEVHSLFFHGSYKGNEFERNFIENENIKMSVIEEIDPYDGIINGFAVIKREKSHLVIYIFVDEDWKQQSESNINIIWGNDLKNSSSLNSKKVSFESSTKGIYTEKISEDLEWFTEQDPVTGGLFFGDITKEDFIDNKFEGKTFIFLG